MRGIDSVNNVGEVLMSNGVLIDLSAPASPMNLVAWFTSERIFIEWDHNQEVDLNHYSVYGGTEADPTTLLFTTSDSSAEAFMPTYEDGNTYYFRITATDIPGNESPFTNDVSHLNPSIFSVTIGIGNTYTQIFSTDLTCSLILSFVVLTTHLYPL